MQIKIRMKCHFTPTRMAIKMTHNKKTVTNADCDVEKLGPSFIASKNVKWRRHFGKEFGSSSKVIHRIFTWSINSSPQYTNENSCPQKIYTRMFIAALFIVAKCSPTDKWKNKMWYIHVMKYYLSSKKEWNADACYNMD